MFIRFVIVCCLLFLYNVLLIFSFYKFMCVLFKVYVIFCFVKIKRIVVYMIVFSLWKFVDYLNFIVME